MGCCGSGRKFIKRVAGQVYEATLSVANVLAATASSGKITVDRAIIEKRLKVCKACPHLTGTRCTVCGCFMNVKAGLNGATCPLKKW